MKSSLTRSILLVAAVATFATVGASFARQEHMDLALQDLQAARAQLQQAEHDKGGYRLKALHDLDQVIADIQNGKTDGAGR